MENRRFIDQAKDMLAQFYREETMAYYLTDLGADPDHIPQIIEAAKAEFADDQVKKYKKRNMLMFGMWVALTLITFVFFVFIVPNFDAAVGNRFLLCLLATILFCVFGMHAWAYNKSWKEEYIRKYTKPNIQYQFFPILILPGVIIYFLFSWRFSSVQDDILKDTQVEVIGHVLNGRSVEIKRLVGGGGADMSSITVDFIAKDGKRYVVTKDISSYELKNFYKDEEIRLIYSKRNPYNISLLNSASDVRNFKGTDERNITPADLLHLVSIKPEQMDDELKKINYGWIFNEEKQLWMNEKRKCAVALKGGMLRYVGSDAVDYPAGLEKIGLKQVSKPDSTDVMHLGTKIFRNDQYTVIVENRVNGMEILSVVTVMKK